MRKEENPRLFVVTDGNIVGASTGQGQNAPFFNVAVVVDGEAQNLSCTKEVYDLAKMCSFGEDRRITIDIRRYGRDWAVRVTGLDPYED